MNTIGCYVLERVIGEGGFGKVHLAKHTPTGQKVVVKVSNSKFATAEIVDAFKDEAQKASLLHKHIVPIYDFGVENGIPYIVMQYQEYGSVRKQYPEGVRVPLNIIIAYVKIITDALQYAHNNNVIHMDVKPENLLIGKLGPQAKTLRITDFGNAQRLRPGSNTVLLPDPLGTPVYAPPEVLLEGRLKREGDQYALACVVFEWLAGRPPFVGGARAIKEGHIKKAPPALHDLGVTYPNIDLMDAVLQKALAKDPKERFASIKEFGTAFCAAASGQLAVVEQLPTMRLVSPQAPSSVGAYLKTHVGIPAAMPVSGRQVVSSVAHSAIRYKHALGPIATAICLFLVLLVFVGLAPRTGFLGVLFGGLPEGRTDNTYSFSSHQSGLPIWISTDTVALLTDGSTKVWDITNNDIVQAIPTKAVAWNGSSFALAELSNAWHISIKDIQSGDIVTSLTGLSQEPDILAWSPDGNHLASAAANSNYIQIWDLADPAHPIQAHSGSQVTSIVWSYDSSLLAFTRQATQNSAGILDVTGKEIAHTDAAYGYGVSWSHSGSSIAFGDDHGHVLVVNTSTGQIMQVYSGHKGRVTATSWSENDNMIASGGSDAVVRIWNCGSGDTIYKYSQHKTGITGVAWSPDGVRIASVSNGVLNIWIAPQA